MHIILKICTHALNRNPASNWYNVLNSSDTGRKSYEIRNAGMKKSILQNSEFEGADFQVTTGDYDQLLEKVRY